MSTPSFGRQSGNARRSAFTLIEVAIALAIFVFGALAIVQIFPPALGVIRNNESRITATQLSETMLARAAGKPDSTPDAIYDINMADLSTITWQDTPMAVVGTSSKNNSLPTSVLPAAFNNSALSRFLYISGERHSVHNVTGTTTKYVLLNSPVFVPPTGSPAVAIDMEEEISGVQIDEYGTLDFRYATDSAGKPFHGAIPPTGAVPPDADKTKDQSVTYYVSYKWSYAGQPVNGVLDEPVQLPSGIWTGTDGRVLQGVIDTSKHILAGGVKVFYRQRLGVANLSADDAMRGYLPLTTFTSVPPPSSPLTAGKTYSFSYLAADWRRLLDDKNAPNTSGAVQLPIKGIDYQPNISPIGLKQTIGDAAAPVQESPTLTQTDAKNGSVPYTAGAGVRYRTVYQTLDGWAQQLSVAAKSYIPFYTAAVRPASSTTEPWREYLWLSADPANIYFHASEAGKTIKVLLNDGTKEVSTTVTIGDIEFHPSLPAWPSGFSDSYKKVARATLTLPDGEAATGTVAILAVQGLSVQARTAWLNADKFNQVIVPGYRNLLQ